MGYFESHVKKKFIEISSYIMNLEKSHTRDLTAHLNTAEKKKQIHTGELDARK